MKKGFLRTCTSVVLVCAMLAAPLEGQKPVSPNASAEATALLGFFYSLSGKYTLTGQHNYPATGDRNSRFAAEYSRQTPAIWSTDMGFAKDGDTDSYLARPDIVREAIRQHRKGSVITICWHAVPPTADEPVTFQPRGPVAPDSLASVQGQLLDDQFKDVLTPGTPLHTKWLAQVDSVAFYLKQLEKAGVPVLWRPYHEMNGDWFWWGGRVGENSTADLYRQLFDRYVNDHKLTNLIWVWNVDRPSTPIRKFSNFYPGNDYLDILSLDVYGSDFNQDYYDSLKALSMGKPLLFGEVGNPPMPDIMDAQPEWTSWVIWAGMARNVSKKQYQVLYDDPRILTQDKPAYRELMAPFREACALPLLPLVCKYPADFSGNWLFNEEISEVGNGGTGQVAYRMKVIQDEDLMFLKKYNIVEWGDDRITSEEIRLDGQEMKSVFWNSPRSSKVIWIEDPGTMKIDSKITFTRGEQSSEMKSSESWSLSGNGSRLTIHQKSTGFRGNEQVAALVYEKQ
ncbi:MAG: glycosyl hydrolase [Bacteroidota bacterium]